MPKRRFLVVVNPRSGGRRGPSVLERVKPVFDSAGVEIETVLTEQAGHAHQIARTRELDDWDGLCLVGGDGTLHEVASGLMARGEPVTTPIGIIPGGTGNSVLQHLGCLDPLDVASRIVRGDVRPFDVLRVKVGNEITYCVNIIGWGAAVDINRTAEWLRPLGPSRYSVAALFHILRAKRRRAKVLLDGQVVEDEFLLAMGCNTRFTGKGMQIAPHAELGDGWLDVVLVRQASRRQMLQMFNRVFDGSHVSLPFVEYHHVRSFGIESESCDALNLDGELKGTTPVSAEIMPAALQVFA